MSQRPSEVRLKKWKIKPQLRMEPIAFGCLYAELRDATQKIQVEKYF
jgi:hypothetical protein